MDASLVVAVVALLVAFWGLYLTALRPADVVLDHVPAGLEFYPGGYQTGLIQELGTPDASLPSFQTFRACVFLSNGGAHTALLDSISVTGFAYNGDREPLWVDAELAQVHEPQGNTTVHIGLPLVLEPADGATLFLHSRGVGAPIGTSVEYARRLGGLKSVDITVAWTFRRAPGALWSVVPRGFRPSRRSVRRTETVRLDAAEFVQGALDHWREREDARHDELLAAASSGAAP
jgi:hypothetical protein